MDRNFKELYEAMRLTDEDLSAYPDLNLLNNLRVSDTLIGENYVGVPPIQPEVTTQNSLVSSTVVDDTRDDYDFSDVVLKYINQILMEEDSDEKTCPIQESAALQAAERSFYEIIGQKYPPSPDHQNVLNLGQDDGCYPDEDNSSDGLLCPNWSPDSGDGDSSSHAQHVPVEVALCSTSQSCDSSSSTSGTVNDVAVDSPASTLWIPHIFSDSESMMQFKKGVEEASKFLPTGNSLLVDVRYNVVGKERDEEKEDAAVKVDNCGNPEGSRGKKNIHRDDDESIEGRSNKQSAVFPDLTIRSEMFDNVLLSSAEENESAVREALQALSINHAPESDLPDGTSGKKSRGKKQGGTRDVVDLRALLTLCAQSVAVNDQRTANEYLKQIRQNSSPMGDGMQRLAHYFANGLEARMAGSGTQISRSLLAMPRSAANVLKAYQLYLSAWPFQKISNFYANKTIMNLAEKASTVHIIHFGMSYGFQWPCFIQRLSSRPGGPPRLRITGIDFPCPGFRPAERIEETGRRLANYAESFNVPFKFKAIAQKWETVKLEDLEIQKDEVVVVNCLFRLRHQLDETVELNSPRDIVLKLIRKLNPDVFIHGIINGAYNSPFFIPRFRLALSHFSSLFDMLDTVVPREIHERMLFEKFMFGRQAMNVIACEAAERVERPETYKQWQARIIRAGFRQLRLNEELTRMAREQLKVYHKDFVIDVDGHWLLQGWKGRIIYALSTWKATS